ncbi:sulfite exporter TauE/SafE family protein [Candidatus Woesearchaeota archaeon]|nr:sulfite exporter TauE/SafE family protein [Candidatus Woesearchaeota archaeon]
MAATNLSVGLQKIQEYNNQLARTMLENVSLFIAFLAGITSLVSPCILPLLPAYFAVTFKERRRITFATSVFFLGFSIVFVAMGMFAAFAGKTLSMIFAGSWIIPLAGVILVFFGGMVLLGKGFGGFVRQGKFGSGWWGVFVSGVLFAIGWTACTGPLLAGVLLMVGTFQNYMTGALLMFFYALGVFFPLFILSFFYDKFHLERMPWLQKKVYVRVGRKTLETTYPNLISGILFVLLGMVFILFGGTGVFNEYQLFDIKQYFYSWQNLFIAHPATFNIIGVIILALFILALAYVLFKQSKNKEQSN